METDLTKGNITKHLIAFTIPLILGNFFQLTYNAADSIIIGRFAGNDALAAVGTADPVMNLLILGITGLCIGTSVLMSNFYGAKNYAMLKKEMGISLLVGGLISLSIFLFGFIFAEMILRLLHVPSKILDMATIYLRVIFIGMPFTCIYNVYAAALRSIGDSKTPIRFLMLASITNVILDIVFIYIFHLGAMGAGLATDIAEAGSALACIIYVYKKVPLLHISLADFKPDKKLIHQTIQYGSTTALQQCSQPIGKLFIQGMVNNLGISIIAAFNAVGKIEDFALVPERSIANSMMTFIAQNDGAGKRDRVKGGFFRGMGLEISYFIFIGIVLLFFNKQILSLFVTNEETLIEGAKYFAVMMFFYWLPALTNGMQGFFRGIRHMNITLYGSMTQISFRVLFTFLLISLDGITSIAYACVIGWIAMLILDGIYCLRKKIFVNYS